jgi:hypothetical protein
VDGGGGGGKMLILLKTMTLIEPFFWSFFHCQQSKKGRKKRRKIEIIKSINNAFLGIENNLLSLAFVRALDFPPSFSLSGRPKLPASRRHKEGYEAGNAP